MDSGSQGGSNKSISGRGRPTVGERGGNLNLSSLPSYRSLCCAWHDDTTLTRASPAVGRRRAPTMPDLSSRNKVPFVSLSHFNGLAGTQRLGLPSRPKAARNSLAKLVMDTRVAFSYLLAGRGLVCPAGASRCGPIHNAGEGEACAQVGWLSLIFLIFLVGLSQALEVSG